MGFPIEKEVRRLEPALPFKPPRKVRPKGGAWALVRRRVLPPTLFLVVGLVWLLVIFPQVKAGIDERRQNAHVVRNGTLETTAGAVAALEIERGRTGKTRTRRHVVRYTFGPPEERTTVIEAVPQALFRQLKEGAPADVRIWRLGSAQVIRLAGNEPRDVAWWELALLVLSLSGAGVVAYVLLRAIRRVLVIERGLVAEGEAAVGKITDVRQPHGRRRRRGRPVARYEVNAKTGQPIVGEARLPRDDTTAVGDRIVILFDPKRPRRNVAYRFSNYEAAE